MKSILNSWILACLLLLGLSETSLAQIDKTVIIIKVKNIQQVKGKIMIAAYDNKEGYMKEALALLKQPVLAIDEQLISFEIPFGKYAFTLFHDLNDNEELDTNFIGIPKEPYGFSNNPKATFGPPGFAAALVDFHKSNQEIEVILK